MATLPAQPMLRPAARWPRATAALLAGAAATGVFAAGLMPSLAAKVLGPLALAPTSPLAFSHVLAAASGAGLLFLARGLWHGSRRAADIAIGVLVLAAGVRLGQGGGALLAAGEAALALLLVSQRRAFARGSARGLKAAAGVLAAGAAGAAYAVAVAALLIADQVTGLTAALTRAGGWLLAGGWWLQSGSPFGLALDALSILAIGAGAVFLHALSRPVAAADGHTPREHERAAAIVAEHAADSLDAFALREDKSFHLAHGGLLAYRVVRETAVVSGDPIGPAGSAGAILASFTREAAGRGWEVVVTAASDRHLDEYRALGLRALRIGDEAVVDPRGFSLDGKSMKTVRKAVGRLGRHGWCITCVSGGELDAAATREIAALDADWRARQARLQGFAMTLGRLWGAREDDTSLYVLGRDATGALGAFLRFTTYPGGLSLDVMRRADDEPNGVNETLIAAALEHARRQGLTEVSLNFAGFAHIMAAKGALTRGQRLMRWSLSQTQGRFQLDRLARFNERFGPGWRPRYLVYPDRLSLPRAGLRVLQAEAYVRGPRERPLAARWSPLPTPVALTAAPARDVEPLLPAALPRP